MSMSDRQRQLLDWLHDHQGLTFGEIRDRCGLYDNIPTSPGMDDYDCSYDLHSLQLDDLATTDRPYVGRWWPKPKTLHD